MKIRKGSILECNGRCYIIDSRIDEGGNGTVWKAHADGDSADLAIKVLNPGKDKDSKKLARFSGECEFCKENNHQNIIKILGYEASEGRAFCIMPYFPKSLRDIIKTENDPFILLEYIIQLCEAIQFIHKKGVIHRDLKPENILINDDRLLVLTDFGIAHFESSTQTKAPEWLGNRRYAAPEQLATDKLTTACDIYALGRIINELVTKQNPSGEQFVTISEKNPLLLPLDGLVQKCRIQDPERRPDIDMILSELYLLEGELKEQLTEMRGFLLPDEDTHYSEEDENLILEQASKDVVIAQHLFKELPSDRLGEINTIYHRNILYDADVSIQNLYFQKVVLDYCWRKFQNEVNSYNDNQPYQALNLKCPEDTALYEELNSILEQHKIPREYRDITACIKKMFCSCCDYHCTELLRAIREYEAQESPLVAAPILHIVCVLRDLFSEEDLSKIELSNNISINWGAVPSIEPDEPDIFLDILDKDEEEVLQVLKQNYNVIWGRGDRKHYYVRFRTTAEYEKFKTYALERSHSYFVFEGDVEEVIRVRREHRGIVELEPLDSFDVTSTLAKILGLRTDF